MRPGGQQHQVGELLQLRKDLGARTQTETAPTDRRAGLRIGAAMLVTCSNDSLVETAKPRRRTSTSCRSQSFWERTVWLTRGGNPASRLACAASGL